MRWKKTKLAWSGHQLLTHRRRSSLLDGMPLVLMHKSGSDYDDEPWSRYHFPETYARLVANSLKENDDWVVYYEPRRGHGRQAYFAVARVREMQPDPRNADHFYLMITEYQDFPSVVPWRLADGSAIESALLKEDGTANKGLFGRAIHRIPLVEFERIVQLGFAGEVEEGPILIPAAADIDLAVVERPLVETVVQRRIRDRAFKAAVRTAYSQTCAFSGLRIVNGGGWTEMEAAHIRPVESNGPDSVRNGLALSRTMHALFDRGFLSLTDEFKILASKTVPLPEQILAMLRKDGHAQVPEEAHLRPHRSFLEFHRENVFKDRAA